MKKILLVGLVVGWFGGWVVGGSIASAEIFKISNLPAGTEQYRVSDKASGQPRWQSAQKVQQLTDQGKTFLYLDENGSGLYGSDKKDKTWNAKSYFYLAGGRLVPYQVNIVYKDKSGAAAGRISKYYDRQNKQVVCTTNGAVKTFDFKDDIVDKEDLGFCLMNYPFEEKRDMVFYLLTHEPTLYRVTFKYKGVETLTRNGKPVDCYKLEMIPDLGALNIFGAFVPKTYFWYTTGPDHDFVRYEGLESGLGTPYIVMEGQRQ
ncbi:MAG: hypothetical protein PHG97_01210 [Candidatus Margulisbacteria bacterium]|nr:hypothetical protein [Candidatus Margulisiibacteriota bacterium]